MTDEFGRAVTGARIVALGTTLATARTDTGGWFSMALPAGEYILRATREGYVSAPRAAVRVQSDCRCDATSRSSAWADAKLLRTWPGRVVQGAAASAPTETDPAAGARETAWRLRHLPRTVLRDWATARVVG